MPGEREDRQALAEGDHGVGEYQGAEGGPVVVTAQKQVHRMVVMETMAVGVPDWYV